MPLASAEMCQSRRLFAPLLCPRSTPLSHGGPALHAFAACRPYPRKCRVRLRFVPTELPCRHELSNKIRRFHPPFSVGCTQTDRLAEGIICLAFMGSGQRREGAATSLRQDSIPHGARLLSVGRRGQSTFITSSRSGAQRRLTIRWSAYRGVSRPHLCRARAAMKT